jgi:hypothetical protein
MDTPAAEPGSYGTFDTLCGVVFSLAVLMLVVGGLLLLGAATSTELATSLVSYGITCFSSGISLLIFSYGGWIFLDLARNNRLQLQKTDEILRNNRLQVQKTDEILEHLAELNPRYEERLKREQEAAQRRAEAEREAAQRKAEAEQEAAQRSSIVSSWPKRNARRRWQQRPRKRKTSASSVSRTPETTHKSSSTKSSLRHGKRTGSTTLPG